MAREDDPNRELMYLILAHGIATDNWDTVRAIAEMQQAAQLPPEEVLLTSEQLAQLLGLQKKEDGNYDAMELVNACLHVHEHQSVRNLPERERLRVIATATALIDQVF